MTDLGTAWLRYQIAAGETALALRQAGHTWAAITTELRLGDQREAQRCAALFLSADLASREPEHRAER